MELLVGLIESDIGSGLCWLFSKLDIMAMGGGGFSCPLGSATCTPRPQQACHRHRQVFLATPHHEPPPENPARGAGHGHG